MQCVVYYLEMGKNLFVGVLVSRATVHLTVAPIYTNLIFKYRERKKKTPGRCSNLYESDLLWVISPAFKNNTGAS